MRPYAGITPLGHAPGMRPHPEPIEISFIVPFRDKASVLPHCLERTPRAGEPLAVPCEYLFVDGGIRDGGASKSPGKRIRAHSCYPALNRTNDFDISADAGDLRAGGRPKWSPSGALRLAIEGVTSFSIKPLRWAAVIGVASAAGGVLFGLWLATNALLSGEAVQGYSSLDALISLFDGTQRLDEQLFVLLNSLGSERWDGLWLFITNKFSSTPLFLALMYLVYRHFGLRNMLIVTALIVVMITATDQLANLFKHGFERPRPCREEHLKDIIRVIAPRCGRYGFFSAHAANSMAFATFLGLLLRKNYKNLVFYLLLWALIAGFSRIYVGVHYPLDTLAGFVIGALAGFLVYRISQPLAHRSVTPETDINLIGSDTRSSRLPALRKAGSGQRPS